MNIKIKTHRSEIWQLSSYQVVAEYTANTVKDPVFFFLLILMASSLILRKLALVSTSNSLLLAFLSLLCYPLLLLLLLGFSLPDGILAGFQAFFPLLQAIVPDMLLQLSLLDTKAVIEVRV